ncbi:hypothetical protein P7228_01880 [Altererythrobacter arenosus]|uniref:DUF2802 domain-containing protein n=1 Tax=Altererythrobacter arenosus TaxID=3032592 RepID=A0ABY8FS59_9SPHN|nr:hypothetical protein [Altererythrobacter sp. CAU 1644]WFL77843.1 hypothetical protein P7228_01880 [Altererythrobacter sp. CAU 1644]
MDFELLIIFGFILIAASMLLSFAKKAHLRTIMHEERKLELLARAEEAKGGKGGETYRKLEERVRVLERIATDSNHALATQIEQLRDLHELDGIESQKEVAR